MNDGRLTIALGAAFCGFGAVVWLLARGLHMPGGLGWADYLLLAAIALGLLCFAGAYEAFAHQRRRLERLRGAVTIAAGLGTPLPPPPLRKPDSIDRLRQSVADLIGRERERHGMLDRRLEAILGAIEDAIVVVTSQGQISLLNAAAKAMLGVHGHLGASLFELLDREALVGVLAQAEAGGTARLIQLRGLNAEKIEVQVAGLGPAGGALLFFPATAGSVQRSLEHDLGLHDHLPLAAAPTEETSLDELAAVSLDTETTGLNVRRDRLLSVAAVPLHGARIYRTNLFDRLVNPGSRIPPASTAVHSITDAMTADAPPYGEIARDLAKFCGDRVWIGHNIGFDIAILRREAALAGLPWREPVGLDTLRLYAALHPDAPDVELDAVAAELDVDIRGRHTALGDALVTAEVYRRLLPLLRGAGVHTLGEALKFAERPRMILRLQRSLGW
jgi:DNA polymerase III subunit epsilon